LNCKIADNGHGIHKSNLHCIHQSKGIKLVQERFDLFQQNVQNISITSKINVGTTVLLRFKIALN
jgi:sensor histidine kinase YesM